MVVAASCFDRQKNKMVELLKTHGAIDLNARVRMVDSQDKPLTETYFSYRLPQFSHARGGTTDKDGTLLMEDIIPGEFCIRSDDGEIENVTIAEDGSVDPDRLQWP